MFKKKILILGSGGQIGFHLLKFLKSKNYEVYEFDLINRKSEDLRTDNNKKFLSYIKKSHFVFFLAFDVGGSQYLKKNQNKFNFIMNNIAIMKNTFNALNKYKKNFIFATSQMSNMSYSSYGVLKKIGENITSSIGGISARLWNVYGIEKNLEKSHVITDFIIKGLHKKKINMLTNGTEERDFLYAEDCCAGFEIIMNKYNILKKKNIIDLSYGKYTQIYEIAKMVKSFLINKNIKVLIAKGKKIDQVQKDKKNIPNRYLRKYWKPKHSLESGIKKLIDYYYSKKLIKL